MTKTFVLNLSKNSPVKINFSYPDFKREGLNALIPILDWVSYITIFLFILLATSLKSADTANVIFISAVVLFATQSMKAVLGGFKFFPKTTLDIGGLLFVALSFIAILLSNTQSSSLFGEGKLSYLAGISGFALLLIYYVSSAHHFLNGSAGFAKKALVVSALWLGVKLFGDRAELLNSEVSVAYYLPILLPFLFFAFLQSKKFIGSLLLLIATWLVLRITNFDDFSFTFSLLVSMIVVFFIVLLGGSEFLYSSIQSLGEGIRKMFKRKINLFGFLKASGKFLIGGLGFFAMFIFSIVKVVENYSNNFSKMWTNLTDVWGGLDGTAEIAFGKGLGSFSGSFYGDILGSFGVVGLVGLVALVGLTVVYSFKMLSKAYKTKDSKLSLLSMGIISSLLTLLTYFKFESVTVYGFVMMWVLLILVGGYSTNMLYKGGSVKESKVSGVVKVGGISILAVVAIIFLYLILR